MGSRIWAFHDHAHRLDRPDGCRHCGRKGTVLIETVVKGRASCCSGGAPRAIKIGLLLPLRSLLWASPGNVSAFLHPFRLDALPRSSHATTPARVQRCRDVVIALSCAACIVNHRGPLLGWRQVGTVPCLGGLWLILSPVLAVIVWASSATKPSSKAQRRCSRSSAGPAPMNGMWWVHARNHRARLSSRVRIAPTSAVVNFDEWLFGFPPNGLDRYSNYDPDEQTQYLLSSVG